MLSTSPKISTLHDQQVNDQVIYLPPPELISIPKRDVLELKQQVGYWRKLYQKTKADKERLKQELLEKEGQIRELTKRLYGKSSEKGSTKKNEKNSNSSKSNRPRGQQPGSKGSGVTPRPDIEKKIDYQDLSPEEKFCPKCGNLYGANGTEDSEIHEVNVSAYTRIVKRKSYKKTCKCKDVPNFITAPPAPRVIPKSPYGISIWEEVLLSKFLYCQPTKRLLDSYKERGLPISQGTITGGMQKIMDLCKPVYEELFQRQMTEDFFHNDESGWKVFESIEGKIGNRWWLWLSRSASVIFFQIAPGRGADVPIKHFENNQCDKVIVVCDRYSAYKSLANTLGFIILAFCWAHIRRDFLDIACKYPQLEEWTFKWLDKIGVLYHINNQRREHFDKKLPIQWHSEEFKKHHNDLVVKIDEMANDCDNFLAIEHSKTNALIEAKQKVLTSLKNHWKGLTVFVEHPDVPMDNNPGERSIRNPVTGRKNYYGSSSLWSSKFAAIMFSIFQTLLLSGINCNHWLRLYLTECAHNGGNAPSDLSSFLPWKMNKERLSQLSKPPPNSS